MSNLMLNKLKHIDGSRRDLQDILERKGVDLSNSNKSLDSLVGNVAQLSLNNDVSPEDWTGVTPQEEPTTYWKGDEDWKDLVDIDAIMEADTQAYTNKAFFLIRCSDNELQDEVSTGYTQYGLIGFQAYRFSDQEEGASLSTTSAHGFDRSKDIIAPNGERFRWIIGYTNVTTSVVMWQGLYLIPEAVVYWSGTYRGICFEDCKPASSGDGRFSYDNGSGGYTYLTSLSITNGNTSYMTCIAPKYFEVKEEVTTQFIIGHMDGRHGYEVSNNRTRTIIIDGVCVCEFSRQTARNCNFIRISKPGYRRYLVLDANTNSSVVGYISANISGCKGYVRTLAYNAYVRLVGDMIKGTLDLGAMKNSNILTDNVPTLTGAENSENTNFDFKIIHGSIDDRCFMNCTGHIKFDYIEQTIGEWAFRNTVNTPKEIIVKKRDDDSTAYTLERGAFVGTAVEKIDLKESGITTLNSSTYDPETIPTGSNSTQYSISQPFYGANSLKHLILPDNLTIIPAWSIARLPALETLTLPQNLITINNYAIAYNSKLKHLEIPESVSTLGTSICVANYNLETVLMYSKAVTTLPANCFIHCYKLSRVILPEKVTLLDSYCFMNCRSLKNIILPNTVTRFGTQAFAGCLELETIEYEDSTQGYLATIGDNCFRRCYKLTNLPDMSNLTQANATNMYSPFQECKSLTITIPNRIPTSVNASSYRQYAYTYTGAKILIAPDFAITDKFYLSGADWSIRNFADFIHSLPDRTGKTALNIVVGVNYIENMNTYSSGSVGQGYGVYAYSVYKTYYCKEIDGRLEISSTQEDTTWITVADYVAAKNCVLTNS